MHLSSDWLVLSTGFASVHTMNKVPKSGSSHYQEPREEFLANSKLTKPGALILFYRNRKQKRMSKTNAPWSLVTALEQHGRRKEGRENTIQVNFPHLVVNMTKSAERVRCVSVIILNIDTDNGFWRTCLNGSLCVGWGGFTCEAHIGDWVINTHRYYPETNIHFSSLRVLCLGKTESSDCKALKLFLRLFPFFSCVYETQTSPAVQSAPTKCLPSNFWIFHIVPHGKPNQIQMGLCPETHFAPTGLPLP